MTDLEVFTSGDMRRLISRRRDAEGKPLPATYETLARWRKAGWIPYAVFGKNQIRYPAPAIRHIFKITDKGKFVTVEQMRNARAIGMSKKMLEENGTLEKVAKQQAAKKRFDDIKEELEHCNRELANRS